MSTVEPEDIHELFLRKIARKFVRINKTKGGHKYAIAYLDRINPTSGFKKRLAPYVKEELKHYGR